MRRCDLLTPPVTGLEKQDSHSVLPGISPISKHHCRYLCKNKA